MLVAVHDHRAALLARDRDRHDFLREASAGLRGGSAALTFDREPVLVLARDAEVVSDILRRLRHRIDTEARFHRRVHEAPADRGVVNGIAARKRAVRLRHHERCACHAFNAACHDEIGVSAANRARCHRHRVEAGAAQAIQRRARRRLAEPGEQRGHARDVAVVFARLVGAAHDDVIERAPIDAGVARGERPQRHLGEIVRPNLGERSAVASDGRARGVADESVGHSCSSSITGPPMVRLSPWNSAMMRPSSPKTLTA